MRTLIAVGMALCFAMGLCQGLTDAEKKKELAKLAGLEKSYSAAKAKFAKSPKDAKAKRAFVDATVKYADAEMKSQALPSKERYPRALRHFREARKVDPKNAYANDAITTIESIYQSLGRPIPPN